MGVEIPNSVSLDIPLPVNHDIEKAVLGSILLSGDASIAVGVLDASSFTTEATRSVWRAIEDLYLSGKAVDRLTVFTRSKELNLKAVTLGYLNDLDENLPQILNIGTYIQKLKDIGVRRKAIVGMGGIAKQLAEGSGESSELLASASRFIATMESAVAPASPVVSARKVIEDAGGLDAYLAPEERVKTIPTPWTAINERFLGFSPGKLYLVAARPSVGKTAFALQCAWESAKHGDHPLFVSLEMGTNEIMDRIISCQANVTMGRMHFRKFSNDDMRGINSTASSDPMQRIRIVDASTVTVPMLRQWILECDPKPEVVFVDYLQLMTPTGGNTRNEEVSIISRGLKVLAKELHIAIVALSQLKRLEAGGTPGLQDLRDSGSLEQDADFVGFLHSPKIDQEGPVREVMFLICKQRSGALGRVMLSFDGAYQRFLSDGDTIPGPPPPPETPSFLDEDFS